MKGLMMATAIVLISGCASSKFEILDNSPMCIVTVVINRTIPWQIEEGSDDTNDEGVVGNIYSSLFSNNDPEYALRQERVDYCTDAIRNLFEDNAGIEVLSPQAVYDTPTFIHAHDALLGTWAGLLRADEAKTLSFSASKQARMIMSECGAKSAIYANFKFEKVVKSGTQINGRVAAAVTLEYAILKKNGSVAKQGTIYRESDISLPLASAKYDKAALADTVHDLVDLAINALIFSL